MNDCKSIYRKVNEQTYFLPFIQHALVNHAPEEMVLAIDGSLVGRGCICLMISLIYKNRALPLVFNIVKGEKGHGDSTDGNSGGPLFGDWPKGPYVIGVESGGQTTESPGVTLEQNNVTAGGNAMVDLVRWARANWP